MQVDSGVDVAAMEQLQDVDVAIQTENGTLFNDVVQDVLENHKNERWNQFTTYREKYEFIKT